MPRRELSEDREYRREIRDRQERRGRGADAPPSSDPGRFGEPGYTYQPGDEYNNPGPEPPRGTPEWTEWKKAAKAWRNFIGGRQRYVDDLIRIGYSPEDLGILPIKEQGLAGWNRLNRPSGESAGWEYDWARGRKRDIGTSDTEKGWYPISPDEVARRNAGGTRINELQRDHERWIRDVAAGPSGSLRVDPTTGFYYNDNPSGRRTYYDRLGGVVDAQGRRIGGAYGMDAGQLFATGRTATAGTGTGNVTGWGTTVGITPPNDRTFGRPTPIQPTAASPTSMGATYASRPYLRENYGSSWGGWGNPYGISRDRAGTRQYSARVGQRIRPGMY